MKRRQNRYVFIDFETLNDIKFKKLSKVADRIYVLINESRDQVPLSLVQEAQHMGDGLTWVPVSTGDEEEVNYHLAFMMGQLHEASNPEIKFAVVSNESTFDPLVTYIHKLGRDCIRVEHQNEIDDQDDEDSDDGPEIIDTIPSRIELLHEEETNEPEERPKTNGNSPGELVMEKAKDTIEQLIRSGNRPAELSTLKSYILMNHNEDEDVHLHLDEIINKLEELQEIEIHEGEVTYNF